MGLPCGQLETEYLQNRKAQIWLGILDKSNSRTNSPVDRGGTGKSDTTSNHTRTLLQPSNISSVMRKQDGGRRISGASSQSSLTSGDRSRRNTRSSVRAAAYTLAWYAWQQETPHAFVLVAERAFCPPSRDVCTGHVHVLPHVHVTVIPCIFNDEVTIPLGWSGARMVCDSGGRRIGKAVQRALDRDLHSLKRTRETMMANRESRYGCRECSDYIPPEEAGIGGTPIAGRSGGRCKVATNYYGNSKSLYRLKFCPRKPGLDKFGNTPADADVTRPRWGDRKRWLK